MNVCAGCGGPLAPNKAPGRQRKWCSESCRRHTLYSGVCIDCGATTYNGSVPPPEHCYDCSQKLNGERAREFHRPHRELIERLWAEGKTIREVSEAIGSNFNVSMMRGRGYNLPHRRTPEQIARITAGSDERLAKARAVLAERKAA